MLNMVKKHNKKNIYDLTCMDIEQLKTIYRIQFPVLQSYEADTWYDAKG